MTFSPHPLVLPEAKRVRFGKSPLALVACQIRFEHLGVPGDDAIKRLRESVSDDYPVVQQLQGLNIQLGSPLQGIGQVGAAPMPTVQPGWRFSSIAQDWTISVFPDSVSVETSAYADWEDLDRRLRSLFAVVQSVLAPRVEIRLGLRYVNQFTKDDVVEPAGWAKYLRPELVALTASELFAPAAFNAQQTVQLDAGDAILTMRHGVPGGLGPWAANPFYLLDIDCFREGQRILDSDNLLAELQRFNRMITSLFQWCVSDQMWEELDPHDK
jgi:uncharacterized protein (TIGR04255 family)